MLLQSDLDVVGMASGESAISSRSLTLLPKHTMGSLISLCKEVARS